MAFNLRPFGKIFNVLMYTDTCTITRVVPTKDEYGATKSDSRVEIYKDIKCKFSFSDKDNPADSNGSYMPVLKQVSVNTDLDHNILPGDFISGYRIDQVTGIKQLIEGICGQPNRYDTHQSISIQLDEEN